MYKIVLVRPLMMDVLCMKLRSIYEIRVQMNIK